jgi:hypothetical protein
VTLPPPRCDALTKYQDCPLAGIGDRNGPLDLTLAGVYSAKTCHQACERSSVAGCCEWQAEWAKCIMAPNATAVVSAYERPFREAFQCEALGHSTVPVVLASPATASHEPVVFSTSGGCGVRECSDIGWSATSLANFTATNMSGVERVTIPPRYVVTLVEEYISLRNIVPSVVAPLAVWVTFVVEATLTNFLGRSTREQFGVELRGHLTSPGVCANDLLTSPTCTLVIASPPHVEIRQRHVLHLAVDELLSTRRYDDVSSDTSEVRWVWTFVRVSRSDDDDVTGDVIADGGLSRAGAVPAITVSTATPLLRMVADVRSGVYEVTVQLDAGARRRATTTDDVNCTSSPVYLTVYEDASRHNITMQWNTTSSTHSGTARFTLVGADEDVINDVINDVTSDVEWRCTHTSRMRSCHDSGVILTTSQASLNIQVDSLEPGSEYELSAMLYTTGKNADAYPSIVARPSLQFTTADKPWISSNVIASSSYELPGLVNAYDTLELQPTLATRLLLSYPYSHRWSFDSGITHIDQYAATALASGGFNVTVPAAPDSTLLRFHHPQVQPLKVWSRHLPPTGSFAFRELVHLEGSGVRVFEHIHVRVNEPPVGLIRVAPLEGAADGTTTLQRFDIRCHHCEDEHLPLLLSYLAYDYEGGGTIPLRTQVPQRSVSAILPLGKRREYTGGLCHTQASVVQVQIHVQDSLGAVGVLVKDKVRPAVLIGSAVSNGTLLPQIHGLLNAVEGRLLELSAEGSQPGRRSPLSPLEVVSTVSVLHWVSAIVQQQQQHESVVTGSTAGSTAGSRSSCWMNASLADQHALSHRAVALKDALFDVHLDALLSAHAPGLFEAEQPSPDVQLDVDVGVDVEATLAAMAQLSSLPTLLSTHTQHRLAVYLQILPLLCQQYHHDLSTADYVKLSLFSAFESNLLLLLNNVNSLFAACSVPSGEYFSLNMYHTNS